MACLVRLCFYYDPVDGATLAVSRGFNAYKSEILLPPSLLRLKGHYRRLGRLYVYALRMLSAYFTFYVLDNVMMSCIQVACYGVAYLRLTS